MSHVAPEQTVDIRSYIMNCAALRFQQFGYGKTTMAEIASDAGMSAANLYRYFRNKQDLGVACVEQCFDGLFATMRAVVRNTDRKAGECLKELVVTILTWTYEQAAEQPRVNELVQMIIEERRDIVAQRDMATDALIAEILSRGNATGEFDIADVIHAAHTVHATIRFFEVPLFMQCHDLTSLKVQACDVVGLLLSGLRRR